MQGADWTLLPWLPSPDEGGFRYWEAPSLPTFSLIAAREHVHDYPYHLHDCAEIIWNHAGRVGVRCRGVTYEIGPGEMCVLAPNELHSTYVPDGDACTSTLIHIPAEIFWITAARFLRRGEKFQRAPFFVVDENAAPFAVPSYLDRIAETSDQELARRHIESLLAALMRAPARFAVPQVETAYWHPAVIRAREALAVYSDEEAAVSEIAADVGLNMRYFIALFKDGTGLSPHQFQIALRVDRARSMLQAKRTPLCEVAITSGFSDQSHLNRHFKRRFGFTPKAFQSSFRLT